jgi:RHS repeat-associated protein
VGKTFFGWHGQAARPQEQNGDLIQMGARPYLTTLGRFLSVDPVEAGTENDYVYPTDPINQSDLSGLCESVEEWCVIGILEGEEDLPDGFADWLRGRNSESYVHYEDTPSGNRAVLSTGTCSAGSNFVVKFRNACKTHDLGYDLMRFFDSSGTNGATRKAVDNFLGNDTWQVCGRISVVRKAGCYSAAKAFVWVVKANSIREGNRKPL